MRPRVICHMMSTVEGRIDGGAMRDISGDDTRGTLLWNSGDLDDDHLICIVSEQAADDYLEDPPQARSPTSSPAATRWTCALSWRFHVG